MSDFKELKVWQKAHDLALGVAEGRGRHSDREQIRFLRISVGSCYELESHLIMARDVDFIRVSDATRLLEQLVEVRRMLFGLIRYLHTPPPPRA